jgi:hypothetical protein
LSPGELIDYGLDRLQLAVEAATPETVCVAVLAATVGNEPARDIALLVIRRRDSSD